MKISVVIPLYNKMEYIERAIKSVLRQRRLPDYIVVIDDGSTDDSLYRCQSALNEAPSEIKCIVKSQANKGVSVARNLGANSTNSDLIALLDADDEWLPDHLEEIERLFTACPNAGILSTRSSRLSRGGRIKPARTSLPSGFFGYVQSGINAYRKGYGILHTTSVAISRDAWKKSGGFLPGARKSQDIQLWLRLLLTEKFAHSGKCTAIRHWEATGEAIRAGEIPAHLTFFLTNDEARKYDNKELFKFLSSNISVQIAAHRVRKNKEDDEVVTKLRALSSTLPPLYRAKAELASRAPLVVIKAIAFARKVF